MKPERGPSFGRALLFALFAGLGALPWQLFAGSLWGWGDHLGSYQLGLTVVCVVVLAPTLRSAWVAGALAGMLCAVLALASADVATATLGALGVLGLTRSALCYPRPFARALACELLLALPSALAVGALHDGSLLGSTLAVWTFWLVQSAFALLPANRLEREQGQQDRFEAAATAAERVMREGSVRG